MVADMASQDSMLSAWKRVNAVTASMDLTGAAPAFRQAMSETDFDALTPSWEFGDFKVHILDDLEGVMVYVDQSRKMAVVGRYLWTIISCHYKVMETMVNDLMRGASGVKLIDYNSGPYREAGRAWRRLHGDLQPQKDAVVALEEKLKGILTRAEAVRAQEVRDAEQYQVLYSELGAASEAYGELEQALARLSALLGTAQDAVMDL